ncbi:MAG: hypothetical protein IAX21_07190 [Candidatus Bathyarchaeota archaeon]|nr:MAG: hypothetical protein IAX21_07190 [Candidatus Bathyarchaeota archaeon]
MAQISNIIDIWKETRNTVNHLDKMMDGIRVTTFTLFGVISSIAVTLNHYAPNTFISGIPLPSLVELILIPVITVLFAQNRMYHYWLYNAIETATAIESILHEELKDKIKDRKLFITYSLTNIDNPRKGYWKSMRYSKIFAVDICIFIIMILTCVTLAYMFWTGAVTTAAT